MAPFSSCFVSLVVMLAVKTVMTMMETTIQMMATKRPGSVAGASMAAPACVIATADHQKPDARPFIPPWK